MQSESQPASSRSRAAPTVATLRSLTPNLYDRIAGNGTQLMEGLRRILSDAGVTATVTGFPQVFHVALSLWRLARPPALTHECFDKRKGTT